MRRFLTDTAMVAALAVAAGTPALAQQGATSEQQQDATFQQGATPQQQQQQQQGTAARGNVDVVFDSEVSLDEWGYGGLYEGTWAAQQVLDAPVYGPTGDEIGEVENILVGTNGTVEGIIAEVGGFWDIGDTHVRVPWSEVNLEIGEDEPRVTIPVTEETVENYDLYGGVAGEFRVVDDDDPVTPRAWRVTELIDDYVTLEDGARYGWVEDLLFDQAGRLKAVVVDAAYGPAYGPYAYPFFGYGYGFYPGYDYYGLPYSQDEIAGAGLEPFEYERFETAEVGED